MDRYRRQVRVEGFGSAGQQQLGRSHALLVGVGALGTHIADCLVRAGIGRLTLVDRDVVESDNLHRQVLFDEDDAEASRPKALAAADVLRRANGTVELVPSVDDFQADSWDALDRRPDVVLDGTDNFATRLLLADLCVRERLPLVYGGAVGTGGRAAVFDHRPDAPPGPCLRCLLPAPPATGEMPTCETAGVLEPAIAQVAAFQSAETLKLLAGAPTTRGLLEVDVWRGVYGIRLTRTWSDLRDPSCRTCGTGEFPSLNGAAPPTAALCGRDAVQVRPARVAGDASAAPRVDLEALGTNLRGSVDGLAFERGTLRFVAQGHPVTVFASGRALIRGTRDPARARTIYDRFVGVT